VSRGKHQDFIDDLVARMQAPDTQTVQTNGHARAQAAASPATDEMIVEKCRAAENAEKFSALFDRGDVDAYHGGDDSAADLALLGILAFWTQDDGQLERIFSSSALGRREKWRRRDDYRMRSIAKALADDGEVYDWGRKEGKRLLSGNRNRHRHSIYDGDDDDYGEEAERSRISSISFAEMPEPERPEEVWEGMIVRGWPALWFGGTGVTKSVMALATSQAIADKNTKVFLGRSVITAAVMYADWELNAAVQGRRAYHIARGHGRGTPPSGLRYMSTYGTARHAREDFGLQVLEECIAHGIEVCFIDSVGLAVSGNPGDFEVIIDFFDETIADFVANGITPVLVDHQRRLVAGERNQSLGAYGSVWKENLSRTQVQIELVTRDREAHTVTTRLRAKKTNFDELPEPIEVKTTFSADAISLVTVATEDTDRAVEETLAARDRVRAAIRALGEAGPNAIQEACGTLTKGTVKNIVSKLRGAGIVEDTGEIEPGGGKVVRLVDPGRGQDRHRHHTFRGDDDDDDSSEPADTSTVAGFFANPPGWLPTQLKVYRENPEKHIQPLCTAVAAEVLGDGLRWEEVAEEVERELEKEEL
jgi:AAA domain